jgi:hypothetical protein
MVATSATAILNDIALSNWLGHPFGGREIRLKPCKRRVWRQSAHAFLTAYVNQPVSAPGLGVIPQGKQSKCWKQSK